MSACALEEVSVLSSIYCGQGEFQLLQQSAEDGLLIQINCSAGGDQGSVGSVQFQIPPSYPSCPPQISVSSSTLSRTQCQSIREKLLDQAASSPPEPMIHQLVDQFQQMLRDSRGTEQDLRGAEEVDQWVAVLLLHHIRSYIRYVGLLRRWCEALHLTTRLCVGRSILVVLLGPRADVKAFCHRLKTEKVDVDSSGRKCKERMMKVLLDAPLAQEPRLSPRGLSVTHYGSLAELGAAFQDLGLPEQTVEQLLPSVTERP